MTLSRFIMEDLLVIFNAKLWCEKSKMTFLLCVKNLKWHFCSVSCIHVYQFFEWNVPRCPFSSSLLCVTWKLGILENFSLWHSPAICGILVTVCVVFSFLKCLSNFPLLVLTPLSVNHKYPHSYIRFDLLYIEFVYNAKPLLSLI